MQVLAYVKIVWHVEDTGIAFVTTCYGYEEILFSAGLQKLYEDIREVTAGLCPFLEGHFC